MEYEIWFPDGVWEHIRSYMDIWKYPYNKVVHEISKIKGPRIESLELFDGQSFCVEYFRELPIPKGANTNNYMLEAYSLQETYHRPINRMYMVKEIRAYPFFDNPLPSIGVTRLTRLNDDSLLLYSSENPDDVFKKTIHTHWLAAGQDLIELGIK